MSRTPGKRQRAETKGRRAEHLAAWFLRLKGFSILQQRYKAPNGEIDLVAKRGRLIAFVEVKARTSIDDAIWAVTDRNRRRVSAAASAFCARHPHLADSTMRYDIIAIAGWRLQHLTNAWQDDDERRK